MQSAPQPPPQAVGGKPLGAFPFPLVIFSWVRKTGATRQTHFEKDHQGAEEYLTGGAIFDLYFNF